MAWYYGTFSCGCEGRTNVIGPYDNRQKIADSRFRNLCSNCAEKFRREERIKQNKEAQKKSQAMELPKLTGTEKQIAWANTLRLNVIKTFNYFKDEKGYSELKDCMHLKEIPFISLEEFLIILDYILQTRTTAKYYIDSQTNGIFEYINENIKEALKTDEEKDNEKYSRELLEELKTKTTVFPKQKRCNEPVEIDVSKDKVKAIFHFDNDFIDIVKKLKYRWNGDYWYRDINEMTGTSIDRAAELGNKLLNDGFPVFIEDEDIKNKAVNGTYEQECRRWIKGRTKKTLLILHERNSKLYDVCKSIKSSKYKNGTVVSLTDYDEIKHLAEVYKFKFDSVAKQNIEIYKKELAKKAFVVPAVVEDKKSSDGLKEILNSSREVLDDLRD